MEFQSPQEARDQLYYELERIGRKKKNPIYFYILEEVYRSDHYFTLEELTLKMKAMHYNVSRHMVGRTVKIMDQIGLIQKRQSKKRRTKIYAWRGKFRG